MILGGEILKGSNEVSKDHSSFPGTKYRTVEMIFPKYVKMQEQGKRKFGKTWQC